MTNESNEPTGRAITAFVFGILGVTQLLPCVGPLLAVFLGAGEESSIGRAGVILGWVGLAIIALGIIVGAVFFLFMGGIALFAAAAN